MKPRHAFILIVLWACAQSLAAMEFDAQLIERLPPSVAEWHSREGIAFCAKAEASGMSWAEAHLVFTGEHLRAEFKDSDCLIFYSEGFREGRIYRLRSVRGSLLLRIVTCPEFGSFQSARNFRIAVSKNSGRGGVYFEQREN
jgi:hypothetical protein